MEEGAGLESKMKLNWVLNIFVSLFLCDSVFSFKHFYHGKQFKVGETETNEFPPDQWFEQQLDHSDLFSNQTWQQVGSQLQYYNNIQH